jgi:hypothetical protein
LRRCVSATSRPPLRFVHNSGWSWTAKVMRCPSRVPALLVTGSIFPPRGRLMRVTPVSGISTCSAPRVIIGTSALQTLSVWSSLRAATWIHGVAHGRPTGSPWASQPSKRTGASASASAQIIAALNGPLPHFCGRTSWPPRP